MKPRHLKNVRATKTLGIELGKHMLRTRAQKKHAMVVTLSGELGAGKSVLARAFASALGVRRRMPSPTFLIARSYPIPVKRGVFYRRLFHLDLYRIDAPRELGAIGFKEIIRNPEHLVLIEWPERALRLIPKDALRVMLRHGKKAHERTVAVAGRGW